ncbi:hypothetical protein [Rhodoplanes serenus]|uniref:hypothetical protein n=1 Tax=Rhodoplanes serenus TaxID=200615 RepID=UPI00131C7C7A|nr:hypothetical protein [Rhodoplanes serenus]
MIATQESCVDGSESGNTLVLIELVLVLAVVFGFGLRELRGLRRDRAAAPTSRASSSASSSAASSSAGSSTAASSTVASSSAASTRLGARR